MGRFFTPGLAAAPTGVDHYIAPAVRRSTTVERVRAAFRTGPFPLAEVDDVLVPARALQIEAALARARFAPHRYGAYPLDVAVLDDHAPPALLAFTAWLKSDEGCAFHVALCDWPPPDEHGVPLPLVPAQVQVSRMAEGQRFPEHIDTDQPGVAAVYGFSRLPAGAGGALRFAGGPEVPPRFNHLVVFRPDHLPHEVTALGALRPGVALQAVRHTITAFYLLPET